MSRQQRRIGTLKTAAYVTAILVAGAVLGCSRATNRPGAAGARTLIELMRDAARRSDSVLAIPGHALDVEQPNGAALTPELGPGSTITQEFRCENDGLSQIEVMLSKGDLRPQQQLNLRLWEVGKPGGPVGLQQAYLPSGFGAERHYLGFSFEPVARAAGKTFRFELTGTTSPPGEGVRLWYDPSAKGSGLMIDGRPRAGALRFRTYYSREAELSNWRIADQLRDAVVVGVPARIDVSTRVPRNAVLSFGFGITGAPGQQGGGVRGDVYVTGRGGRDRVFRQVIEVATGDSDQRWIDASIDMSRFAGQHVRMSFEAAPTSPGTQAIAAWAAPRLAADARPDRDLNVLLVVVDALRPDHLGCYGYRRSTSPHIDRLAHEGTRFEEAIAPAPTTAASSASTMTATYPCRHEVFGKLGTMAAGLTTLAQALRDNGYATTAFVSNSVLDPRVCLRGIERGFDVYDVRMTHTELNRTGVKERLAGETTRDAKAWLQRNGRQKFFLWLHYIDPHGPYLPPEPQYRTAFAPPSGRRGRALPVSRDNVGVTNAIPQYQRLPGHTEVEYYVSQYDGEIAYTDHYIGELLSELERLRLSRRTLVVLTADHGELLGEHGRYFLHGETVLDAVIKVPLIVRGPGVPSGQVVGQQVSTLDVMPTILAAALRRPGEPAQMVGRDILTRGAGSATATPGYSYDVTTGESCVRTGRYKHVWRSLGQRSSSFYDLKADPAENGGTPPPKAIAEQLRGLASRFDAAWRVGPSIAPRKAGGARRGPDWETLRSLGYVND